MRTSILTFAFALILKSTFQNLVMSEDTICRSALQYLPIYLYRGIERRGAPCIAYIQYGYYTMGIFVESRLSGTLKWLVIYLFALLSTDVTTFIA